MSTQKVNLCHLTIEYLEKYSTTAGVRRLLALSEEAGTVTD